jgi:DNA gyrase subunit A
VFEGDEIMLISDKGTLVRTRTEEISSQGRNTQGVRLIKLKEGENLVGLERIEEPDEEPVYEDESEDGSGEPSKVLADDTAGTAVENSGEDSESDSSAHEESPPEDDE